MTVNMNTDAIGAVGEARTQNETIKSAIRDILYGTAANGYSGLEASASGVTGAASILSALAEADVSDEILAQLATAAAVVSDAFGTLVTSLKTDAAAAPDSDI